MNVVDSSGWIEFFADGPNAGLFEDVIADQPALLVPTLSLTEVFKVICRRRGEMQALSAIAVMEKGRLIDLDADQALRAASIGLRENLSIADSIILACARAHNAILWTQDSDFKGMSGVRYVEKK